MKSFVLFAVLLSSSVGLSWGKRGHEISASIAARLLSQNEKMTWLRPLEFDLGYYCNVPDIIFRNLPPEESSQEGPLHYIDWERLDGKFKSPKDIPVDFAEYKKEMGSKFKVKTGLSPWRISDLVSICSERAKKLTFKTQGELLVCIGVLSHYTSDLAMPLHNSENHDGQKTKQKGIHAFFETILVDQLDPALKAEVLAESEKIYPTIKKKNLNANQLVRDLMQDSIDQIDKLLKIDKGLDREDIVGAAKKFKPMIVQRLATGAVYTALIWKTILDTVTDFEIKKFYFFDGKPEYIGPRFLKGVIDSDES